MSRRKQFKLSYPKAIAVAVVFCAVVLNQFQVRSTPKYHHKKVSVQPNKAQVQLVTEEATNTVAPEVSVPVSSPANCLVTLSKLNNDGVIASVEPSQPTKVAIKKVTSRKRVAIRVPRKLKERKRVLSLPHWINEDLENGTLNSQDALDNPAPLDEIALASFREQPLEEGTSSQYLIAEVQTSFYSTASFPFEMERPMLVKESVFQKMEFDDLNSSLVAMKTALKTEDFAVAAPAATFDWKEASDKSITNVAQVVSNELANPTIEAREYSETAEKISQSSINVENYEIPDSQLARTEGQTKNLLGPVVASAPGSEILDSILGSNPKFTSKSIQRVGVGTQNLSNEFLVQAPKVNTHSKQESNSDEYAIEGKLLGELVVDDSTMAWMQSRQAHIELYLNKVGSRDPQDTIFLHNFQFPNSGPRFEFDSSGIRGKYNLVAGVYVPESSVPVAQVLYQNVISSENFKEKIRLQISKTVISEASVRSEGNKRETLVPLNLTMFDGAPSNYRMPKAISGARVRLVGLDEKNTYQSDKEGNVRIAEVPVHSEVVVEVEAPGYYPTRVVVPVFSTATYQPVYLIEKDKVDAVTNYFTKKPQQSQKSLIMGRVYEPQTRTPKVGETFMLSHRKGSAVYFGALPDLNASATLDTGLFGFYNIEPSFRAIGRASNRPPLLLNMEPGYGYFLEFGRGGEKKFKGRLVDPFTNQKVFGSVQFVGSYLTPSVTSETGKFQISEVDLPAGLVTIEVNAEGYPRTWFTVPWSTREAEKERTFYLMERDLLKESASRIARIRHEKNTGVIAGGLHASVFDNERPSLRLELVHTDGSPVSEAHGPFSLSQVTQKISEFKLTPKNPGFAFFNLAPGEYLLKMVAPNGKVFRTHVVRVGVERVSIVVN